MSPVVTPYVDKTNWVINLSSRSLSDAEKALLKKGLNFTVTPANIPATEIIMLEELLTVSFNRQNHQRLTSRRTCEIHLKV